MAASQRLLQVTLVRSPIGCPEDQKRTVKAMGLNRIGKTVTLPDNPSVRGMVRKVAHLVRWQGFEIPTRRGIKNGVKK